MPAVKLTEALFSRHLHTPLFLPPTIAQGLHTIQPGVLGVAKKAQSLPK